ARYRCVPMAARFTIRKDLARSNVGGRIGGGGDFAGPSTRRQCEARQGLRGRTARRRACGRTKSRTRLRIVVFLPSRLSLDLHRARRALDNPSAFHVFGIEAAPARTK